MALARELDRVAGAARRADPADHRQRDVLRGHARRKRAVDLDQHRLRFFRQQALRREHVLDFGGSNAERQRGERAVRAGMRVAADDGHPRQRRALLRADHVDDALPMVAEREIGFGAMRADIGVERFDLGARNRVANAVIPIAGRRVVIGRCDNRADAPGFAARELQSLEGLRARDLVHQVAIDVEQRRAVGFGADDVAVPQFVVKRTRLHGQRWLPA